MRGRIAHRGIAPATRRVQCARARAGPALAHGPDQLRRARLKCAVRHAQQLESRCRRRLRQEVQERNALGAA